MDCWSGSPVPITPQMPTRVITCSFKYYTSFNVPKRLSYLLRADEQGSNEYLIDKYLPSITRKEAPVGTWFIWNDTFHYVNKKGEWRMFGLPEAHCGQSTPLRVEDDPEGDNTDQEEVDADLVDDDD